MFNAIISIMNIQCKNMIIHIHIMININKFSHHNKMIRNLYIRTISSPSSKVSSQAEKRKIHINRIKNSLRKIPMIQKNISLNKKRISLDSPQLKTTNQYDSDQDIGSPRSGQESKPVMNILETFESRYDLLQKLGQGSSGLVRKCKQKLTNKLYAVKSFSYQDEQLPNLKSNFLLMKRLRHKNIINYESLYIDTKKRTGWLVMQLIEAPSLQKVQLKNEDDIKKVMVQILEVLHYLHQHHIVHRDIKGSNVLIYPENKEIKVVDFGIAKRIKKRGALIEMWTVTGTLYYRAPEILTGGGYHESVDIWASGVLLYKLVAGRTPFQSQYHHETIQKIRSQQIVFPPQFQTYSPQLKILVGKMLTRNQELRPSACECLRDCWISDYERDDMTRMSKSRQKYRKVSVNLINIGCRLCRGGKIKDRMPQKFSLNLMEEQSQKIDISKMTLDRSRLTISKINGHEYHSIGSDFK